MADIKKAAKWLSEGKSVRCASWANDHYILYASGKNFDSEIGARDGGANKHHSFDVEDLLADDWEIAEG